MIIIIYSLCWMWTSKTYMFLYPSLSFSVFYMHRAHGMFPFENMKRTYILLWFPRKYWLMPGVHILHPCNSVCHLQFQIFLPYLLTFIRKCNSISFVRSFYYASFNHKRFNTMQCAPSLHSIAAGSHYFKCSFHVFCRLKFMVHYIVSTFKNALTLLHLVFISFGF